MVWITSFLPLSFESIALFLKKKEKMKEKES